jgi:hypothetical protein
LKEGLEKSFFVELELKKGTVDLIDDTDGLNALGHRLTEHDLSLQTNTIDSVNNDKGTISDSEGSSDLGREVSVSRGVNKIDKELVAYETVSPDKVV